MNRALQISGFLILAGLTMYLFAMALQQAWMADPVSGLVVALIFFGLAYEMLAEGFKVFSRFVPFKVMTWTNCLNFLSVILGTLVTYALSVNLGLGPVIAAGLVGILAAVFFPAYGVPIYCGAFVGMSSSAYFTDHPQVAMAGVLAGLIYVVSTGVLNGFGGKLGTIAYGGSLVIGIVLGSTFSSTPLPNWEVRWIMIFYSVLACVATYFISIYLKQGPVMASGIVGLAGGLLLPVVYLPYGNLLAVLVICASFAGMSNNQRFPRFAPLFLGGAFTGMIFIYTLACLGGPGGKLGIIGFGSVMALRGYLDLFENWRSSKAIFSDMKKEL
ncbi:MAG TPA: hypothetical protein VLH40_08590 [Atribacteraceae bacterium]|nr:hypothetical protein [Atribacteraceae bacterium]